MHSSSMLITGDRLQIPNLRMSANTIAGASASQGSFCLLFCRRQQLNFSPRPSHSISKKGLELRYRANWLLRSSSSSRGTIEANLSAWEDEPYEVLSTGKRAYLDEQDVVTFLDPPKELVPLDPAAYNPAAYLWKKIGDIPDERRQQLLRLLKPRLISRAWMIAGTRYKDPNLANKYATELQQFVDGEMPLVFWICRTSGGPMPIAWLPYFRKAIFRWKDDKIYGRFIGVPLLEKFTNSFCPLYFMVKDNKEVMATEQPCDFAYEFGEGNFDLYDFPSGFPRPARHPYPFNDQVVVYIRHLGPGVLVGQAWQEGKELQQVPKKLCGEILMVRQCLN